MIYSKFFHFKRFNAFNILLFEIFLEILVMNNLLFFKFIVFGNFFIKGKTHLMLKIFGKIFQS